MVLSVFWILQAALQKSVARDQRASGWPGHFAVQDLHSSVLYCQVPQSRLECLPFQRGGEETMHGGSQALQVLSHELVEAK